MNYKYELEMMSRRIVMLAYIKTRLLRNFNDLDYQAIHDMPVGHITSYDHLTNDEFESMLSGLVVSLVDA